MAIDIATARTEIAKLYIAAFNRVPDSAGLDFWVDSYVNKGQTLNQIAQNFTNSTEYKAKYPAYQTNAEFVEAIYQNVFGRASDAAGKAYWEARLVSTGADALTHGTLMQAMVDAAGTNGSTDGAKLANQATFAVNAVLANLDNAAATAQLANVTSDAATITTATAATTGAVGQTYTLTTAVDNGSSFVGTTGADTFNANLSVNPATGLATIDTLGALDVLDGGAGVDTLNFFTTAGTALAGTISNIENIVVRSGGAVTADVTNATGVKSVSGFATAGAVNIDTFANATSATVTGTATTVAIDELSATGDVLATISVTGNTGAVTIGGGANGTDALTTFNYTSSNQNATITAAAATRTMTMNLDKITAGTLQDATATTVVVNSANSTTTVANGLTALNAAAATSVTVNSTVATTVSDVNIAAATTLNIGGTAATTIAATSTVTALTAINASTSTGGATITPALGNGVTFTGGTGADSITLAASIKAHTMGAGNDTVTLSAAAMGTNGTVDAGTGTDTLAMTAANAVTASATTGATAFETTVSNFEKLAIGAVAVDTATTIDMAGLDDINYIITAGRGADTNGTADALTFSNVVTGGTVEFTGDTNGTDTTVINVSGAATNAADVFNLKINTGVVASVVAIAGVTLANVETVNISTADTGTATGADIASSIHTGTLTAAAATSIVVSGNNGLNLTATGSTAVTNFDASAVVGNTASTLDTAANLAVTYTSLNATATAAVTIKGGAGDDALTGAAAIDTIYGNDGIDNINGMAGNDILNGGAGADTITGGAGNDTLTGGAGNDTFVMTTVATNATTYDIITDIAAGDIISFGGAGAAVLITAAVTPGVNAVFQDYVDAAVTAAGVDDLAWFQYNGNTFVVQDLGADSTTFANGVDNIVQLTGLVNLANSTLTVGGNLTIV